MIGRLLDRSPLWIILCIAVMLAIAPLGGTPHLVEKISMAMNGRLSSGIDLFDLLLHSSGILILLLKLNRMILRKEHAQTAAGVATDATKEQKDHEH